MKEKENHILRQKRKKKKLTTLVVLKKTNLMAIYESSRIQSSKVKTIPY